MFNYIHSISSVLIAPFLQKRLENLEKYKENTAIYCAAGEKRQKRYKNLLIQVRIQR